MFQSLVESGHNIDDIKYQYTIDQVYLYYEKIKKIEMDKNRMTAIILARAIYCMSPSEKQSVANSKNREWQKLMDSLDFDALTRKKDLSKSFSMAGIPIIKPKKGSTTPELRR